VDQLARARTADDVRRASRLWTAPSQQIIYADRDGRIGRMIVGRIPLRAGSDGSVPLPANDPAGVWTRDLTEAELPAEHEPASGFVIGANERFESDSGAFISNEWCNPYRAQRLREVLGGLTASGIDDHARLQLDTVSVPGRELQALLLERELHPQSAAGARALQAFATWNCDLSADSAGGAVYGVMIAHLQQALWAPLEDLAPAMLGTKRGPALGAYPRMFAKGIPRILRDLALDDTELLVRNPVLPDTWDELLTDALDIAGTALDDACGERGWAWGEIHRIRIAHGLGFIPGVHGLMSRGPWPSGGDFDTVWQAAHAPKIHNDAAVVGPAQRMVIDLANPDRSRAILCGGQSGHSTSPHYDDQLELWRRGQLRPMPLTAPAVAKLAVRHEQLIPS
jgi:penicillin amidase